MMRRLRQHPEDIDETLSAYVDDELDIVERRRVEQLIADDPARRQQVEELRLLKSWMRDLPTPQPRRSFTIDPATVVRPRRLLFPTLRWATVVAAVLLMLTIGVDAMGNVSGGQTATSAPAPGQENAYSLRGAPEEGDPAAMDQAEGDPGDQAALAPPSPDADDAAAGTGPEAGSAGGAEPDPAMEASAAADTAQEGAPIPESAAEAQPVPDEGDGTTAGAEPAAAEAEPAAGDTALAPDPSIAASQPLAADTIEAGAPDDGSTPPNETLRVIQIVLLLATIGLGAGAWLAWRNHI